MIKDDRMCNSLCTLFIIKGILFTHYCKYKHIQDTTAYQKYDNNKWWYMNQVKWSLSLTPSNFRNTTAMRSVSMVDCFLSLDPSQYHFSKNHCLLDNTGISTKCISILKNNHCKAEYKDQITEHIHSGNSLHEIKDKKSMKMKWHMTIGECNLTSLI